MAKHIWLFMIVLTAIIFISGCTGQPDASVKCPGGLQVCGSGCIPANAVCCDDKTINSYCLQPAKECGDGTCNECEYGKVFCGMTCIDIGSKCCFGGECKELVQSDQNQDDDEELHYNKPSVYINDVTVTKTGPLENCFSGQCAEVTIDITGYASSSAAAKLRVTLIYYPADYSTYTYNYETHESDNGDEYVSAVGSSVEIISNWTEENNGLVAKSDINSPLDTTWSAQYTFSYTQGQEVMVLADITAEVDSTIVGRAQDTKIITPVS